jgi:hypothetical protein
MREASVCFVDIGRTVGTFNNYDVDNPGSVLGQAQQCGRVKPVNGICLKYQTIDLESDHKHLSHKCPILRLRH